MRGSARAFAVIGIVAGGVCITAAPVAAVENTIEVSHDGATFVTDPTFTLFDDIGHVVPGDTTTETVWVRSTADDPGRLRVDLVDVVADDAALADATSIALSVDGTPVGTVTIGDATGDCVVISGDGLLAPGETSRLDVTMAVAADLGERAGQDGLAGTRGEVGFRLRATLTDADVPAPPDDVCTPTPGPSPSATNPAPLPETGMTLPLGLAAAGAAAGAAGAILLARRQLRRQADA